MVEPSEVHRRYASWAVENGVKLHKVRPAHFPGAGVGMIATQDIKMNETLTFVPVSHLLNIYPVVPEDSEGHGDLAAKLLELEQQRQDEHMWKAWLPVLPPRGFEKSLPMFWEEKWMKKMNQSCADLVRKQIEKFEKDYARSKSRLAHLENCSKDDYRWAWAVVNSRTVFFQPKSWNRVSAEDCMTLCPMIDYYNHTPDDAKSCIVRWSKAGFSVISQQKYKAGDEAFVTYGRHSNDALICEYGFALPGNEHDNTQIDEFVLELLEAEHKHELKELSFLGEYFLIPDGLCYRTQVAISISVIPTSEIRTSSIQFTQWKEMMNEGLDWESINEKVVRAQNALLEKIVQTSKAMIDGLASPHAEAGTEAEMLTKRWKETLKMAEDST